MDDMLKIRIETTGPEAWRLKITDLETGRIIPVLWRDGHEIVLHESDGVLCARVDLMVWEVDAELIAKVTESVEYIRQHGYDQPFRVRESDAPAETADDFAARTVALVTRKDGD